MVGPMTCGEGLSPYLRVGISPPTFSDLDPAGAVSRCQGGISTPTRGTHAPVINPSNPCTPHSGHDIAVLTLPPLPV